MENSPNTLTRTERQIALLLVRGLHPPKNRKGNGNNPLHAYVHISNIRRKTGFQKLEPRNLTRWLERFGYSGGGPDETKLEITPAQRSVLTMVAEGVPYWRIAALLKITIGTAWNHTCEGCIRLGVIAKGRRKRAAIAQALGIGPAKPGSVAQGSSAPDPMDNPLF